MATTAAAAPSTVNLGGSGEHGVRLASTGHPSIHLGRLTEDPESRVVYIEHRGVTICEVRSPKHGVFTSSASERLGPLTVPHEHVGPTCACEDPQHALALSPVQTSGSLWPVATQSARGACDDPAVVDLLVYYTTDAMMAAGGEAQIEAEILLGLANTNTSLLDSNIPASINLVASLELDYAETGSGFTDINQIRSINDGVVDEIHATRDELRADLVMLVTDTSAPCGIAGYGLFAGATPAPDNSFSVINRNCIGGGVLVFAHEIGHNLGVFHDWPSDQYAYGATIYAKGYTAPDDAFRTVMSISANAPRQLLFSSPDIEIGGQPAGKPFDPDAPNIYWDQPADAARAIRETIHIVAGFRSNDHDGDGICDADEILAGTAQDVNGNGIPDEAEFDCNRDGIPDSFQIAGNPSLDANSNGLLDSCEPSRLYVNAAASGDATGTSWQDAHTDLQDALLIARRSLGTVSEIWVAAGSYCPSRVDARGLAFEIPSGVTLLGGFDGTETVAEDADPIANSTILTGDALGDDGPDFTNRADNSFNVVRASENDFGAITIDGFTIRGGNADLTEPTGFLNYHRGGGMTIFRADVTMSRCIFTDNQGSAAGALYVSNFSTTFFTDCDFIANRALYQSAGAVYTQNNPATNFPTFDRCRFYGNTAPSSGGAVTNIGGTPTYINCLFVGNSSGSRAGAMGNSGAVNTPAIITNCTFVNNWAGSGGNGSAIENFRSAPTITNSIFWNNGNGPGTRINIENIGTESVDTVVANSLVEGWVPGDIGSNIVTGDPMFASLPSESDYGDLSLTAGSAAIDAADNTQLPAFITLDFAANPRFVDDPGTVDTGIGTAPIADLGAYEFQPSGTNCPADVNGDGTVNLDDLDIVLSNFGQQTSNGDTNSDGTVNLDDLDAVLSAFGTSCD